jgi:hypothetical protein
MTKREEDDGQRVCPGKWDSRRIFRERSKKLTMVWDQSVEENEEGGEWSIIRRVSEGPTALSSGKQKTQNLLTTSSR